MTLCEKLMSLPCYMEMTAIPAVENEGNTGIILGVLTADAKAQLGLGQNKAPPLIYLAHSATHLPSSV